MSGITSIDESTITGESMPVNKDVGDEVFNGTMNGSGSIVVEVTKRMKIRYFKR